MSDDDGWHLPVGVPSGAVPSGGAPSGALLPGGAPLRSSSAAVPEDATPGVRSTDQAYRVRWVPNPPITAAIAAAVFLAGLALVTARVEFALVAAPLLVIAALGHDPARGRAGVIRTRTAVRPEDNGRGVMVDVELRAPQVAEAVAVVATLADGSTRRVLVTPSTAAALRGPVTVLHSGPQAVVRLDLALIAQGGTAVTLPEEGPTLRAVVPPPRLRIEQLPMPHRLVGTTGTHESSSRGDGGEFRDLALFAPGDRLRRIDWRRTARRAQQPGELYVRRTSSTADAVVVIVLDDRDDVGPDVTRWSGTAGPGRSATSLDLAREAATTLASAYIGAGDRVGFRDLAGAVTGIEPRGGCGSSTASALRRHERSRRATPRGRCARRPCPRPRSSWCSRPSSTTIPQRWRSPGRRPAAAWSPSTCSRRSIAPTRTGRSASRRGSSSSNAGSGSIGCERPGWNRSPGGPPTGRRPRSPCGC